MTCRPITKLSALALIVFLCTSCDTQYVMREQASVAPQPSSIAIRSLESDVQSSQNHMRALKMDQELLEEKVHHIDQGIADLKNQELQALYQETQSLKRHIDQLSQNESTQQDNLTKVIARLEQIETSLEQLQKQTNHNIAQLKKAMTQVVGSEFEESSEYTVYEIQPGDSLDKIAKKFQTKVSTIKELNELSSDVIITGKKLKLPK